MWSAEGGGVGLLLTLMTKPLMTATYCLSGSIVLPDVELIYMSHPLRRGGRGGMGKILNTCFKVSAKSAGRRQHMCVHIVRI